jgi:3-hydroxyisobutyrate dehydrogenase
MEGAVMQIGVAGLGRMGAAIAARLIDVGHTVTVWNRSAEKARPLADKGAMVAPDPAALARGSEAVITILTDAAAIDAVYHGAGGLLEADARAKLFVEMSTVRPDTQTALAERVRAKGGVLVECPVGGTVGPARDGKLLGLAGAEPGDLARARPLLDQLCRRVEHCGPVGSAAVMKLAINLPLLVSWQAYGEAFALARDVGFDPQRLMDLFIDTSGATTALKGRAPMVAAMLGDEPPGPTTFAIDSGRKDLQTMLAEADARGVALPLVERALASFDEASRSGWGERDASSQCVYWARRAES